MKNEKKPTCGWAKNKKHQRTREQSTIPDMRPEHQITAWRALYQLRSFTKIIVTNTYYPN